MSDCPKACGSVHMVEGRESFGAQHGEGAGLQREDAHVLEGARLGVRARRYRGCTSSARRAGARRGEIEIGFVVGVEEDGERVADDALALLAHLGDLIAGQHHAEAARVAGVPIGIGHLGAVRLEPVEVLDLRAVNGAALEKVAAAEDGLRSCAGASARA